MSLATAALVALVVVGLAVIALQRFRTPAITEGDAAVLEQLRSAGSDLAKPHEIEFFFYLPTEASAQHIAEKLGALELKAEVRPAAARSTQPWHVLAVRHMIPDLAEIQRLRSSFTALAQAENGEFDGWGTTIVP